MNCLLHAARIKIKIEVTHHHRFGFTQSINSKSTSPFLWYTPISALKASANTQNPYFRQRAETPPSILSTFRSKLTSTMNGRTTTPLRGDQQPPIDEEDNEIVTDFVPFGGNSPLVTIFPRYFHNEGDLVKSTNKRIKHFNSISFPMFSSLFMSNIILFENPAIEPGHILQQFYVNISFFSNIHIHVSLETKYIGFRKHKRNMDQYECV